MLTSSHIFFELEYSTLVSNLYGLMRHILYLICVAPHCKVNVLLVKKCVIKNGPLYGVSYFYAVCLLEHEVISNFIVIVNSMFIFTDIIFINLRLILLTY